MIAETQIPEPILFNPLKHHLGFIREFIYQKTEGNPDSDSKNMIKELKHLGTSVMDVYTGSLLINEICNEVMVFLRRKEIIRQRSFFRLDRKRIERFQDNLPDQTVHNGP